MLARFLTPLALMAVISTISGTTFAQGDLSARARAIHKQVPLIDGHNDYPWALRGIDIGRDFAKADITSSVPALMTDIPRLRQGGVGARDAHLGDQIEQSDERLESHLQEVLQHSLGQLDSTIAVQPGIAAGTDAGVWDQRATAHPLYDALTQMVSSPRQMQAAIVLSEIIRRPEERWS